MNSNDISDLAEILIELKEGRVSAYTVALQIDSMIQIRIEQALENLK